MFLLIPKATVDAYGESDFTFQYVSINTENRWKNQRMDFDFTFQYVSINTTKDEHTTEEKKDFTFQYVSINTRSSEPPINSSILYHILSTMVFFYLFIYFDITRFTGSTILLMFFTFVDLS